MQLPPDPEPTSCTICHQQYCSESCKEEAEDTWHFAHPLCDSKKQYVQRLIEQKNKRPARIPTADVINNKTKEEKKATPQVGGRVKRRPVDDDKVDEDEDENKNDEDDEMDEELLEYVQMVRRVKEDYTKNNRTSQLMLRILSELEVEARNAIEGEKKGSTDVSKVGDPAFDDIISNLLDTTRFRHLMYVKDNPVMLSTAEEEELDTYRILFPILRPCT